MNFRKFSLNLLLLLISTSLFGQAERTQYVIDFVVGKTEIHKNYKNNSTTINLLSEHLNQILRDSTVSTVKISVQSCTSPEGAFERNNYLAQGRVESIIKLIEGKFSDFQGNVEVKKSDSPHSKFAYYVSKSNLDDNAKKTALEILSKEFVLIPYTKVGGDTLHIDARLAKLQSPEYSHIWKQLEKNIFSYLRCSYVDIDVYKKISDSLYIKEFPTQVTTQNIIHLTTPSDVEKANNLNMDKAKKRFARKQVLEKFTFKTNGIGWLMLISNVAAEIHFSERWSLNLPFYYSGGVNYFVHDVKFRGIVFQPEMRYHFEKAKGLFVGAHAGVGWYNFALNGDYRIQDAGGKRPAIGGGLGVGYRFHFPDLPRWGLEFSLGVGAYDAVYDKFYNEKNGPIAESNVHTTFIGIDNASVSIIYSFGKKITAGKR